MATADFTFLLFVCKWWHYSTVIGYNNKELLCVHQQNHCCQGFLFLTKHATPPLIIMDRTTVIGCFLKKINDAAIACISLVSCYNHERKVEIIL